MAEENIYSQIHYNFSVNPNWFLAGLHVECVVGIQAQMVIKGIQSIKFSLEIYVFPSLLT